MTIRNSCGVEMKKRHKLIVILIIFVVVVLGIVTKQRANKRERFQQVQIMFENQVISEMEEKMREIYDDAFSYWEDAQEEH